MPEMLVVLLATASVAPTPKASSLETARPAASFVARQAADLPK